MPAKKVAPQYNRAEMLYCKKKYGLDEDIQVYIKSKYREYKNILTLARDAFADQTLTENSTEYDGVKNYVVRVNKGIEIFNFNEDQLNFIAENGETMRPSDIARTLFPDKTGGLIQEIKSVVTVLESLEIKFTEENTSPEIIHDYSPPKTDHKIIAVINRANPDAKYCITSLDSEKKRCISATKKHLNSTRFVQMVNCIRNPNHRIMFEEEFVKDVYDKPDLPPPEVAAYMNLSNEYVISLVVTEQINNLNDRLKEATDDTEEAKKYTKNLSDSLSTKADEFDACHKRMDKLRQDLIGKRHDRLKHMSDVNKSLAKFVELARSEEGREYMLKLAEKREDELKQETVRISNLSDLVAEIHGISVSEILKF